MPRFNADVRQGAYLPHWTKDNATYAVRIRLADSLPQHVLKNWIREKKELLQAKAKRPLTQLEQKRLHELSSEKVERFLVAGYGACWLQRDEIAQIVVRALQRYDGTHYRLYAWCIMPNHVHIVVRPLTKPLFKIVQTWKRVTATKANRILGRSGTFWQAEYFDHLIRNDDSFRHQIKYTWKNPEKAGLKNWKWRWRLQDFL